MKSIFRILRYWHTIRYLKPVQIYGRLWFRLHRPKPDLSQAPSLREKSGEWCRIEPRRPSMVGPWRFQFLNQEHELRQASDWNNQEWDRLWLYNLHYFDDLNARGAQERQSRHRALMGRWIRENLPGSGNGWEPYPTSLRVVNWIKWILQGNEPDEELRRSLAVQIRYLRKRLEYHLLGNHLLANAKALVFAGLFFEGCEAEEWLSKGIEILEREVSEQIMEDGGHFERSPMYHAIILEDFLDLLNILRTFDKVLPQRCRHLHEKLSDALQRMRVWLGTMCHPDGEIVLFNDAAFGVAQSRASLEEYATLLGLAPMSEAAGDPVYLRDTGYVRVQKGNATIFIDVAPLGPDYLPGHAHADTLSFELSCGGKRVIVDSGTSCYGNDLERQRQRSTAAHNTVEIDGSDSSEVWGGFRVARRARPFGLDIVENGTETRIACSHDGYRHLCGKPVHRREWRLTATGLKVRDSIQGRFRQAIARFHFHPEIRVELTNTGEGSFFLPQGQQLSWRITGGVATLRPSTYHPEFGVGIPSEYLEIEFAGNEITTEFSLKCTSSF